MPQPIPQTPSEFLIKIIGWLVSAGIFLSGVILTFAKILDSSREKRIEKLEAENEKLRSDVDKLLARDELLTEMRNHKK